MILIMFVLTNVIYIIKVTMRHFYFLILASFLFLFSTLNAQQIKKDYRKLHYLSEEEMNKPLDTKDFTPTALPEGFIRNVAEFDRMQSVLVRYPFGIPVLLVKKMAEYINVITVVANNSQKQTVINIYSSNGVNLDNCSFLIAPTNTYWIRDYGPWFIFDGNGDAGIVDFPYNRPRPSDDDIPIRVAEQLGINLFGMDVIHTGGNYMCDGMGKAASTDLVVEENSISEQEIKNRVHDYLGIDEYFITEDPLHEYIKHIDCWGKFLAPDKVLIGQVPESDWRYEDYEAAANFFKTHNSSYGEPYKVYRVYTPGSPTDTPYTNSLILNNKVFVPITGSQWDDEALQVYQEAMPGYEIIGIEYWDWMNTDALHCRTKGVADINQLYIWHVPVHSKVDYQESYNIEATLFNYSKQPIIQDSVFVIYKINQSDYDTLLMTNPSGDNVYTSSITGALPGDTVRYYLFAVDQSGHRATHPFIGKPDPHVFVVKQNDLVFDPDTVVFANEDDVLSGIPFYIINPTENPINIDSITPFGNYLGWYINEDYPDLPYTLNAGDTLSFIVRYMVPVKDQWYYDTMFISTPSKTYKEIIKVDSLVAFPTGGIADIKTFDLKVSPNPFTYKVTLNWGEQENYNLKIFDITGKEVFEDKGYSSEATWVPQTVKKGVYFYNIEINGNSLKGKIVKY